MRADYPLYVVALVCFIVAGYGYAYPFADPSANLLLVITLSILGVVFAGTGYAFRTRKPTVVTTKPPTPAITEPTPAPPPPEREEPTPPPTLEKEPEKAPEEAVPSPSETAPEAPPTKPPVRRRKKRTA